MIVMIVGTSWENAGKLPHKRRRASVEARIAINVPLRATGTAPLVWTEMECRLFIDLKPLGRLEYTFSTYITPQPPRQVECHPVIRGYTERPPLTRAKERGWQISLDSL